ncbi:MAG: EthD domain-containing protein [Solirubrobacterales bacterium]
MKRPDLTDVEFHEHWRYTHGPLAAMITTWRAYCQCHLVPRPPQDLEIASEFGGTAEVWWGDLAAAEGLVTNPEYTENALPDEPNFIDMERMVFMTVREQVVHESAPLEKGSGGLKVIHLVTRPEGQDPDEFRLAWEAADEADLAGALRMDRFTRTCCIPEAYAGERPPAFDATREMWWPDEWAFAAARERQPEAWAQLGAAPLLDPGRSPFLVTTENRVVWFD